jgi:hypothetical protein
VFHLSRIARVRPVLEPNETLLDTPCTDEAVEDGDRSGLIVRARRACTAERLLAHDGAGALLVVVDVACGVPEGSGCADEGGTVVREARQVVSEDAISEKTKGGLT